MKAHEILLLIAPTVSLDCNSMHAIHPPLAQHQPYAYIAETNDRLSGGRCKTDSNPDVSRIFGRIQFVDSFPDYKVQVVGSFPDLKVKKVNSFPDQTGKWQIVDSFPDYKIQIVDSFPDFKIQYVDSFPGVP